LSYDTVSIGGIAAQDQPFILVEQDSDFDGMMADGLLGLGFSGLSDHYPTLIDSLYKQGQITKRLFSVYLNDNDFGTSDQTKLQPSSMNIGDYDLHTYAYGAPESMINYLKVIDKTGYWAVKLDHVQTGTNFAGFGNQMAILDTGSSLIMGPDYQVKYIGLYMQSQGDCVEIFGFLVCDCQGTFPALTFTMSGISFSVTQDQYFLPIEDYCLFLVTEFPADFWILGDVFLRNYYAIYDMDNLQVGLVDLQAAQDLYNGANSEGITTSMIIVVIIAILLVGVAVYFILDKLRIKDDDEVDHRADFKAMT
jgi:hypothetical protein